MVCFVNTYDLSPGTFSFSVDSVIYHSNNPAEGSNPDHLIRSRAHLPRGHRASELCLNSPFPNEQWRRVKVSVKTNTRKMLENVHLKVALVLLLSM